MKDFPLINSFKLGFPKLKTIPLPLALFILLLAIVTSHIYTQIKIKSDAVLPSPIPFLSYAKYPVLGEKNEPEISAKAALVMDSDSKTILFAKNQNLRFSSASTTKIMTALIALEQFYLNDILTIKTAKVEGSTIGFEEGERVRFEDLLYGMLLPSGNDAALSIAQNYPLGERAFIDRMNQKAKELNLYNTHFGDAQGLLDNEDYTSVVDLARLAEEALKNSEFAKIVATKSKVITNLDGTKSYAIKNLNELLGTNGVNGVKTGYTDEAGQVLVTSKMENKKRIIAVVMGSADRFQDTEKLLDLVSGNLTFLPIHP